MQYAYYKVEVPFQAASVDGSQIKQFVPGSNDLVAGKIENGAVISIDGFVMPMGALSPVPMAVTQKPMQQIKQLKGDDVLHKVMKQNQYSVNGAMAGMIIGFIYAVTTGKSVVITAVIGAVAGGASGFAVSKFVGVKTTTDAAGK